MGYRLGVDVGGTFTDICLFNEESGGISVFKLPSTPDDPSKAIENGIDMILASNHVTAGDVTYLAHGTTVATNAAIERKGAKTAVITTKGFRDLLELGRQTRPSLYNLFCDKPEPLVSRRHRKEITERLMFNGSVLVDIDLNEVESVIEDLLLEGIEAVAVCFLHSYMNPSHEDAVKRLLHEKIPNVYVSTSSDVLQEFREYERFSTTVLNSYLGPIVGKYVTNFATRVWNLGIGVNPYINQSNSGVISIEVAKEKPVRTALSGPSAGVAGAVKVAGLTECRNIITFDMGGTSTDVCLVENLTPKVTTGKKIAGFPVQVPMTDVNAVGAGGGSIAWIDSGGMLKVGPHSAGASPGPAAYGWGGQEPTVTDANVILRRLNPKYILGGKLQIDYDAAVRVIENKICSTLGLNVTDAAKGIITLVNSNMVRAIRAVSVERGYDPRDFTLVSFGGAGALHAAAVARELGMSQIIIPESPGILCALGLLVSDLRMDYSKTRIVVGRDENNEIIHSEFLNLENRAGDWFAQEQIQTDKQHILRNVDMRYAGQNYELTISVDGDFATSADMVQALADFHAEHKKIYGYSNTDQDVEFVSYRVIALGEVSNVNLRVHPKNDLGIEAAVKEEREVYFDEVDQFVRVRVYDRRTLGPGDWIQGPSIVEQMDATTVIPPYSTAHVDDYGNIVIELMEVN
ncbi:hydantoinase/oxoprolinase family protein [Alicyclobacillus tolerans]|uniref:hydantoinase/oxoprolinase family protein n=1 Tax=Alicyclobacillus tolerans TaxID=90970 RepID=UPI001F3E142B|nr:hydantoinase/oxoprolinase family protein [Alicyclobacillus tolerans]MCF8568542.1 hydantoinase/oxoprolinase family protein [Alicyclobacillus tolerans]